MELSPGFLFLFHALALITVGVYGEGTCLALVLWTVLIGLNDFLEVPCLMLEKRWRFPTGNSTYAFWKRCCKLKPTTNGELLHLRVGWSRSKHIKWWHFYVPNVAKSQRIQELIDPEKKKPEWDCSIWVPGGNWLLSFWHHLQTIKQAGCWAEHAAGRLFV